MAHRLMGSMYVHKIEVSKEAVRAIDQWLSPLLRNTMKKQHLKASTDPKKPKKPCATEGRGACRRSSTSFTGSGRTGRLKTGAVGPCQEGHKIEIGTPRALRLGVQVRGLRDSKV